MEDEAQEYYRELGREYPTRIRQLVPGYDEMARTVGELLARALEDDGGSSARASGRSTAAGNAGDPSRVLDLGIGEGTLARRILQELPGIHLIGVDASGSMLESARERLEGHRERVSLLQADLVELDPPAPLAAAYSSLTLHNLSRPEKVDLLARLRERLAAGAPFVWADLVRHPDPWLQEHFLERRIDRARRRGCPEDFIAWNFEKEGSDDAPVTLEETRALAGEAGFGRANPAWVRNLFAVFVLRE